MTSQGSSDVSQAWQQAVQDYTNRLSPTQQKAFKAPATVQQCLQVLSDHRSRKKAFTRILEFFRPLVDPLTRFEGAVDVIVQTNAGIASPIWGPLRLVIMVDSEHFKTLERLALIIDKITASIRRWQDFEALFATHEGVRDAAGALYCNLIDFCTRVVRFHARSFRSTFVSFDKDFGQVFEALNLHGAEIDSAANAAHIKESGKAREEASAEKQAQSLHRLQCWLSPSTVEDDLQKYRRDCMDGSCDWVVTSTEYKEWLNEPSPVNIPLQILGRPGSGKSTVAAFLVRHLSKSPSPVLYFFCNQNDNEKNRTVYVLRTLLAQLLLIDTSLADKILPYHQQSGRLLADLHQVVSNAFGTAMAQYGDRALYIIIDAVDECIGAREYNGLLCELWSSITDTKVKFVFTRRDDIGRWSKPWSAAHKLTLKPEYASQFIHRYLEQRLQKMVPIANTELETQVVTQISKSADGLWLYARLMADEVERAPSEKRVRQRLASLPDGLSDLYTQILKSCEARMTDDHKHFAKYFYIWLDVSDYMPDFLSDDFDRLPYHMLRLIFCFVNEGQDVFDAAALAREIGTPLIQVHTVDSTYELDFVHRSAYQYLTNCSSVSKPISENEVSQLPNMMKPLRLKRLHRGVSAVWYFTECSESAQQLAGLRDASRLEEFFGSDSIGCYFLMAYGLWDAFRITYIPSYLSRQELSEVDDICRKLTDFIQSGKVLRWFEMATIINYTGNYKQLLDNVIKALSAAQETYHNSSAAFQSFNYQRRLFFLQWVYVLQQTTPWRLSGSKSKRTDQPRSSTMDWIAPQMSMIAERWAVKSFPKKGLDAVEDNSNDDKLLYKPSFTLCSNCSKVFDRRKVGKHSHFACKSLQKVDQEHRRAQYWSRYGGEN